MRIPCPHCGSRDMREFVIIGDASVRRPDPQAPDALARFIAYVYTRENPAGPHQELWYHGSGCQAWLAVTRDTNTHAIIGVRSFKTAGSGA